MRSAVLAVVLLMAVCWSPAAGWGHIFSKSRFRPEAGPNWGYGGIGQHFTQGQQRMPSPREQLLEALLGGEQGLLEEQLCEGRRCTSNDQCCDDFICGAFDGASGSCVSAVSQREGGECIGDSDCNAGSFCDAGFCVAFSGKKGYNEPCTTSSECEVSRGLCCQVVRRYRQEPKTLCGYFKEPMVCFGHVAVDQVKDGGALKH